MLGATQHDFGMVLARNQILKHDFVLSNLANETISFAHAEALTPCCSSIGPLPSQIAPYGQVRIPIEFKAGRQSGVKTLGFEVFTTEPTRSVIRLAARVNLAASFEAELIPRSNEQVLVGQGSEQRLKVTTRRIKNEGVSAPTTIQVQPPLKARFVAEREEHARPNEVAESTTEVKIEIPPSTKPGRNTAEVKFFSSREECGSHVIFWDVLPLIEIVPSGIAIRASQGKVKKRVVLNSRDRSFRLTGCSGRLLSNPVKLPSVSAKTHVVELEIDPMVDQDATAFDVSFRTDNPDQPVVVVSVAVIPS